MIEAVRIGTVFASNAKAYSRWRRTKRSKVATRRGLTGDALEAAIMATAGRLYPDNVIVA